MLVCVRGFEGFGVWIRVGCPCPPIRNIIETPRHLLKGERRSGRRDKIDS